MNMRFTPIMVLLLVLILPPAVQADQPYYKDRHTPVEIPVDDDAYFDLKVDVAIDKSLVGYYISRLQLHTLGLGVIAVDEELQNRKFSVSINATFAGVQRATNSTLGLNDYVFLTDIDWQFVPSPYLTQYLWVIPGRATILGNESWVGNITVDIVVSYTIWVTHDITGTTTDQSGSPWFMLGLIGAIIIALIVPIEALRWARRRP